MKNSEYYKNEYPLESFDMPKEAEVSDIVNNCDYTYEADNIVDCDGFGNKVNTADAVVFYNMGYADCMNMFSKRLVPFKP